MSQIELSERSGVSLGSIKRFESSGEISLHGLVKISEVLHCEEYFLEIFAKKQYQSIEEVINDK